MILSWFLPWIVIPFSSCKRVFKIVIPQTFGHFFSRISRLVILSECPCSRLVSDHDPLRLQSGARLGRQQPWRSGKLCQLSPLRRRGHQPDGSTDHSAVVPGQAQSGLQQQRGQPGTHERRWRHHGQPQQWHHQVGGAAGPAILCFCLRLWVRMCWCLPNCFMYAAMWGFCLSFLFLSSFLYSALLGYFADFSKTLSFRISPILMTGGAVGIVRGGEEVEGRCERVCRVVCVASAKRTKASAQHRAPTCTP